MSDKSSSVRARPPDEDDVTTTEDLHRPRVQWAIRNYGIIFCRVASLWLGPGREVAVPKWPTGRAPIAHVAADVITESY